MDMNIRDELASLIDDRANAGEYSEGIADAILTKFGVVPLDGVERREANSGGVHYGTQGKGYPVYVRGSVMHSYAGYWNLAQGDDPTPAIAAMILAMREAQGAVE